MAMLFSTFTAPFLVVSRASNLALMRPLQLTTHVCRFPSQGSPIAGLIVETYGGTDAGLNAYRPAMYYAGALSTASLCCILTIRLRANSSIRARL